MRNSEQASNEQNVKRDSWNNKTEFVLSSLGYCIGIGNVWRFPYLCYRSGGGAFLVPYLLMLFFCGVPLYFLETSLGQFSSSGCVKVFNISPIFKGAGLAMIVVNLIVTTYFVMLCAYPILFLYYSFQPILPWAECNNPWNTDTCTSIKLDDSESVLNNTQLLRLNSSGVKSSSEEFFSNAILQISDGIDNTGGIVWPLFICNFLAWAVTYLCMSNGIKSIGKVVYFTATFPFLIIFVLLLRGLTLPGAWTGIYFYIYPQWEHLTNFKVWIDAAVQIFFSLGPGWGGIINMASYNNFNNNNKLDSIIIPLCCSGTSIVAGFVVFSVLGFMSYKTGIPVASVATGGPGLAFVTYPEAISLLPWPNLWAILFFLMLFLLGLGSVFVTIEAVITSITDEFPKLRRYNRVIAFLTCFSMWACSIIFTTNAGIYWLTLLDWYASSITVMLICAIEVIAAAWIYGINTFIADIEFMIKDSVGWFWWISWTVITPAILIIMFLITITHITEVTYNDQLYPQWSINLGWTSCYISIICIPTYMGYLLLYLEEGDLIERMKSSFLPLKDWGPSEDSTRLKWIREVKLKQIVANETNEFSSGKREPLQVTTTV